MDKPADPATPFGGVYQHFWATLEKHGSREGMRVNYLPGLNHECPTHARMQGAEEGVLASDPEP